MMRALWTASTGMLAQQCNVDVISNNLSNVNTTGYKKERIEFKDMLYETIQQAYLLQGEGKPVNLQIGHGTTPIATVRNYDIGNLEKTDSTFDFAIEGEGFFRIMDTASSQEAYTRDGSFKLSPTENGNKLVTSDGFPVLDNSGVEIIITEDTSKIVVSSSGEFSYADGNGNLTPLGITLGIVKFPNRQGLQSMGKNLYHATSASGTAVDDTQFGTPSKIAQGYLESSNVQVVDEMVKLIVAQRAYEVSSKAIQSADEMLGMANNLRK